MTRDLDAVDLAILELLRRDGRASKAAIGRRVGLTSASIIERLRKLEASGAIRGYRADVDPEAIGLPIEAYVFVRDNDPSCRPETGARLAALPGVEEVAKITGADTFLVRVRVADTRALARLLEEEFGAIRTIASTRTSLVLEPVSERPLADPGS
jgi:Lrp/AsnC family leucine-responsive transcriptional regulator